MLYFKENKERKMIKHPTVTYSGVKGNYEGEPMFITKNCSNTIITIDELGYFYTRDDIKKTEYWEDILQDLDYDNWSELEFLEDFNIIIEGKE